MPAGVRGFLRLHTLERQIWSGYSLHSWCSLSSVIDQMRDLTLFISDEGKHNLGVIFSYEELCVGFGQQLKLLPVGFPHQTVTFFRYTQNKLTIQLVSSDIGVVDFRVLRNCGSL